jgi:hypothetical protein
LCEVVEGEGEAEGEEGTRGCFREEDFVEGSENSLSLSRVMWQKEEKRNPQKESIDMHKQNHRKLCQFS